MKKAGLSSLYERFRDAGVTVDIIWILDDTALNDDMLKLTPIEKLKYHTAKEKQQLAK